ncbi:MAG: esterase/lipase family protein [Actinomycetes bacterium]
MRDKLKTAARAVCSPAGVLGIALETAWVATHVASYPFGLTREKLRELDRYSLADLPPLQRGLHVADVEAAGTPILLLHGMVDNRSIFTLLRRGLRRRGFGRIVAINYSVLTHDIPSAARSLAGRVERVCAETGYERVHIVGHSLGGLIARYYVQRLGGDERVHTLVCLGTPHGGTHAARLLPRRIAGQLRTDSDVIAELAQRAPGCRTRFISVWSDLDQLIVPKRSARIDHPDLHAHNVFVRGLGHLSLPVDGRVVHAICTTLAQLDSAGNSTSAQVVDLRDKAPARKPARKRGFLIG